MSTIHPALILLGFGALVLLLHRLGWLAIRRLVAVVERLPARLRPLLQRVRDHETYARAAARYPRLHTVFVARLSTGAFGGLPLTLVACVALVLLALLAIVVRAVLQAQGIDAIDKALNAFFTPYRGRTLLVIFLWLTDLGAGPAITAVALTATAFLWVAGRPRFILSLWVTLLGADATTWSAKYLVGRVRPDFIDVASATSPSFPSGHSTASMAVYGFLAYVLARHRPSLRTRYEIAFWAALLIGLIGFSRVFLSVHYASDVFSGLLVGSVWLLAGVAVAESAQSPPQTPVEPS